MACEVRPHIAHYFGNNESTDYCHLLFLCVSYEFVDFGKLLGRYWDLKQCLKAKIVKVAVASCDHQKSKLLMVAVADGF